MTMCVQCVAQGAPFVGVAVTMLNRRNVKRWAVDSWQRVHRSAPLAAPEDDEGGTPDVGAPPGPRPVGATSLVGAPQDQVGVHP